MNSKYYLTVMMCLIVLNCRTAKPDETVEEKQNKQAEIKQIWQNISELDQSNLTQLLAKHENNIIKWMEENCDKGEEFHLTEPTFIDLLVSLNLSLEELRDLNERLGKKTKPVTPTASPKSF
ncbi:uncharacterized protein LOC126834777 [Adelges cooleyi]|uniref:uncharacterized protein LOC126834777 n=1 Tax=Adelges cooleyi TaxID=133065 RepID=UPI0021804B3A|nr:uncharacterized protein LOC126834777 [Adelges cooleyi]